MNSPVYSVENGLNLLEWFMEQPRIFESILEVEIGFVIDIGGYLYGGKIDALVTHPQYPNSVIVVDHKTTGRLTQTFLTVALLSRQFTGYILSAHLNSKVDCHTAMVQIITTKAVKPTPENPTGFRRVILPVNKSQQELESFIAETKYYINKFLECESKGFWPRSGSCGGYGSVCPYLPLCVTYHSAPPTIDQIDRSFTVSKAFEPWKELKNKWKILSDF